MKIYEYKNYEEYVSEQTAANRKKINWSAFNRTNGPLRKKLLSDMGKKYFSETDANVLCHGTRGGHEQRFFKELFPKGNIHGTEISDTAENFPMTSQWDFTKENEKWINQFDIVYSNSFDHSIEPEETLNVWKRQLKENGYLILEWSEFQSVGKMNSVDPLEASLKEIKELLSKVGFKIIEQHHINQRGGDMLICKI